MVYNRSNTNTSLLSTVDWWSILIYFTLALFGWVNIYAAVYDETHSSMFDISQRYGSQILWIGVSSVIALFIMLTDSKYYMIFSYILYYAVLMVLLGVMFFGSEVNGAKAWIKIGSFAIQPAEFAKFATALALARYMSSHNFDLHTSRGLSIIGLIIFVPVTIIILQNDTGSALVFTAFFLMLYREGFNTWLYFVVIVMVALFVLCFFVSPLALLGLVLLICLIFESVTNGYWAQKLRYLAAMLMAAILLYAILALVGLSVSLYMAMVLGVVVTIPLIVRYSYHYKLPNVWLFFSLFVGSLLFVESVDYVFDNVLQVHQQKRILDILGLESDPKGWSYNVIQSKIAIGSGGLSGKGFLEGTQTKFNFVPEQSTDFIFCTIGEEWGFLGSMFVVTLFTVLIFRLMRMGERQPDAFGRIYCYCVASIFLFHLVINVGMTIGILPVIGIPLPFFSYGGSSFIAFTILLFVALRLDSSRNERASMMNFG